MACSSSRKRRAPCCGRLLRLRLAAGPGSLVAAAAGWTTGAVHLFGRCGIRPGPGCRAAGPVRSDLALVFELVQDKPDGLVADTWHGCPDVGEAERDRCMAQDVLADAQLLGSRRPR